MKTITPYEGAQFVVKFERFDQIEKGNTLNPESGTHIGDFSVSPLFARRRVFERNNRSIRDGY